MEKQTLHFTLGDRFGQLITDVAQEHIQYNYNLAQGLKTIEQGLIGIPRDMVLDIITGHKVITVDNGEEVFVTKRNEGHDALGYHKFNPSEWTEKEIDKLVKSGDDLANSIDLWIEQLRHKKRGHIEIDFNSSSLMKYIFHGDDSEVFLEIDDALYDYLQLQLVIEAYLAKADKVLLCIKDLYQLSLTDECKGLPEWVIDIPPTLQVIINIKSQIKELVDITKCDENIQFEPDSIVDKFVTAQREIDKVEKRGIEVADITLNYNAGWLAPNGDYYGLNGEIANMLHNQMGDMLVESGIITLKEEEQGDGYMMERGWLKLHDGQVLGDHVYHQLTITKEQNEQLVKYASVQDKTVIYMNHDRQFISKARLAMTSLEALTDMLDYGMRKEGVEYKPSIRNIQNNPNFK